jgi:hypothetical protein
MGMNPKTNRATQAHGSPNVNLHIDRLVIDSAICGNAGTRQIQAALQEHLRDLLERESFQVPDRPDIAVPSVATFSLELTNDFDLRALTEKTARSILRAVSQTMTLGTVQK